MVKEEKLNSAILAIQDLIIWARNLAYQKHPSEALAELLDEIEYLPALILEKEDRTDIFESYLKAICTEYGFPDVWNRYRKSYVNKIYE